VYHIASGFLSIQCLVESVENKTVHFDHGVGCDQAGPQPPTEGWYVDNVFEECDAPGEYYFSAEEKALYYTFNATEGPTGLESFALTTTKVIFNVSGTQAVPVVNVTIRGLTIRDAALTYLGTTEADIHYNPSDSDWVIQRSVSNAGGTIDFATDRLVPSVLHGPCTGSILATCIVLRNCLPACLPAWWCLPASSFRAPTSTLTLLAPISPTGGSASRGHRGFPVPREPRDAL
jgi:hypothetical protein